jgi:hypothetical protein
VWDQADNPVLWLTDRTLVRTLIGNYDSLPDVYTLGDYERETAGFDVRGSVWSDAGAADPVAAAEWAETARRARPPNRDRQSRRPRGGRLRRPRRRLGRNPLVRSVRVRLAAGLMQGAPHESTLLDQPAVMEHFTLMARHGLVATIEARATSSDGDAADP